MRVWNFRLLGVRLGEASEALRSVSIRNQSSVPESWGFVCLVSLRTRQGWMEWAGSISLELVGIAAVGRWPVMWSFTRGITALKGVCSEYWLFLPPCLRLLSGKTTPIHFRRTSPRHSQARCCGSLFLLDSGGGHGTQAWPIIVLQSLGQWSGSGMGEWPNPDSRQ